MKEFTWSDRRGHRGRMPHLYLIVDNQKIHTFEGADIDGVCVITHSQYTREGKWSHTRYELALADNVRPLAIREGWEMGTILEGIETATGSRIIFWRDLANALGVPLSEARRWFFEVAPDEAKRLDEVQDKIEGLDEVLADDEDMEIYTVTFGGPTRALMEEGYWDTPVIVVDQDDNEVGRLVPKDGHYHAEGKVALIKEEYCRGYHGGDYSLTIAAPKGCIVLDPGQVLARRNRA